ncbi:MAG: hypothetical protein LBS08_01480 [Candidatus Symbiothrix sp.]|jgi:hypothetical protein|nr:hypothetical protein [Candidatus Symbiothrix sp.]
MKRTCKIGSIVAIAAIMFGCKTTQQIADKETHQFRYEIEATDVGSQGTYQLKVWTYSKDANTAIEQAKKNAVHGVIFKGYAGKAGVIAGQRPLVSNPALETEREDYFKPFFTTGGRYQQFVGLANNGAIASGDRIKIGKEYKIGVVVSVNVAALRKDLETAGIIKKLGGGF